MVVLLTGSKTISAEHGKDKAGKIQRHMRIQRNAEKSSRAPWGKRPGKRRVLERWNHPLRQRLARFVRKTLSFSKSFVMHDACLKLFLHRYNLERAPILM